MNKFEQVRGRGRDGGPMWTSLNRSGVPNEQVWTDLGRVTIANNKNAFQYDEYHPLQWPSRGVSACQGGMSACQRGCLPARGCLPRGCLPRVCVSVCHGGCLSARGSAQGVSACQGGMSARGCLPARGVSPCQGCLPARRRCLPAMGVSVCQGVSAYQGGVFLLGGVRLPDPSPVDRMTDTCKNITLPQADSKKQSRHFSLAVFVILLSILICHNGD